jgi:hypothetical protein
VEEEGSVTGRGVGAGAGLVVGVAGDDLGLVAALDGGLAAGRGDGGVDAALRDVRSVLPVTVVIWLAPTVVVWFWPISTVWLLWARAWWSWPARVWRSRRERSVSDSRPRASSRRIWLARPPPGLDSELRTLQVLSSGRATGGVLSEL